MIHMNVSQEKWQSDEDKVEAQHRLAEKTRLEKVREAQMQRAIAEERIAAQASSWHLISAFRRHACCGITKAALWSTCFMHLLPCLQCIHLTAPGPPPPSHPEQPARHERAFLDLLCDSLLLMPIAARTCSAT